MARFLLAGLLSCLPILASPPPVPAEKASRILAARNLGLAQLEEGKNKDARKSFERLAGLVPDEPLPLANGAIAALRDNDLAAADSLLARALKAGGEMSALFAIKGAIEEARNKPDEARSAFSRAAAINPKDLESRWRLVRSVETIPQPPAAIKEARRKALSEIVFASSANLPARLKLLLYALETAALPDASKHLDETAKLLAGADAKTKQYSGEAQAALLKGDAKTAALKVRVLENLLRVTPLYQQSLAELFTNIVGLPLEEFRPDLEAALRPRAGAAIPVTLKEGGTAEDPAVTLRRVDLASTGKPEVYPLPAPYARAAFLDFDLDGDLDVYLSGAPGPDKLLRNNLDGTFTDATAGTGDSSFRSAGCTVADFDRDGDLDLACVDAAGNVVLRSNLRQGHFRNSLLGLAKASALDSADLDADGLSDLVAATKDGIVALIGKGNGAFEREAPGDLGKLPGGFDPRAVLLADLDNDGFPDLVASGSTGLAAFRRSASAFAEWPVLPKGALPADRMAAIDIDSDGDLDLMLSRGGKPAFLTNEGGNANGWLVVVLEGLQSGSGKVNRAGVGSLVEVKAGDLYVARTVNVLPTHIGLGARTRADVVRTLFTNGVPQNQLDVRAKTIVKEVQQLKGSCPFVYTLNGKTDDWHFVSDALGRAPIGLLYDGVHLAGADTREWLFIDRDQLQPTPGGRLLLDYTEELWEVTYLDEATLMAVDHPEGTAVVPNERTTTDPLERKLFTVAFPRPLRAAVSDAEGKAEDVLTKLRFRDKVYAGPGPETHYQGVRGEHSLVLDIGPVTKGDRVVLFLDGWIFYTDVTINVSMSQRKDVAHFPPVLEVPDGNGGWRTAIASFGFPSGKTKTMPVDLTGLLDPADPRVRIRTTMAIFWDQIFVTVNDPEVPFVMSAMPPEKATLSVRGFSRMVRDTPDGPELFVHDEVTPPPKWEDVPGTLTRMGEVTELLKATDDRYVAFQGGDSIRIEYSVAALPPLRPGWRRDWVLVSDGWDKDFDKNTVTGQSVSPWPFHAMSSYPYPETEEHPHPDFIRDWMTRATGPGLFQRQIREWKRP